MSKKDKKVQSGTTTVMYVGPTIPGIVEKGRVYNNGYTKDVEDVMEKCPVIKELMVTTDKIGEAMEQIKNKKGSYFAFYSEVTAFIS